MDALLRQCDQNLRTMPCCHEDGRVCNCYTCLRGGFYGASDTYECEKRMNYYVLNYGPSYASEIFHCLGASQIIENHFLGKTMKVLSLGCGFAPDLLALERYITQNKLDVNVCFHGVDLSNAWQTARYSTATSRFSQGDVTQNLALAGMDIVFVVKLFSTLLENKRGKQFLDLFGKVVQSDLQRGGIVIFNDVNHYKKGREVLHNAMKPLFSRIRQFYFSSAKWIPPTNRVVIQQEKLFFPIPSGLRISPKPEVSNAFFLECRK